MEAWVNFKNIYTNQGSNLPAWSGIISKTESGGYEFEYSSYGVVVFDVHCNGGYNSPMFNCYTPQDISGVWHHFAGTFDGVTARLYIDGVLKSSSAVYSGLITYTYNNALLFGSEVNSTNLPMSQFIGLLTDVRIWNYARTSDTIALDMHNTLTGTEPGLLGYWDFHEGSGLVLHDMTANHNDGDLVATTAGGVPSGTPPAWVQIIGTLPVELTAFSAKANGMTANLTWTTATEKNNNGFAVEKSQDKKTWKQIDFVKGSSASNVSRTYAYTDNSVIHAGTYYYRLRQTDNDGTYSVSEIREITIAPGKAISLAQNFPNPANPSTKISFYLPKEENVSLKVFNAIGKEVGVLCEGLKPEGRYEVRFDGSTHASGVYYYVLRAGSFSETKKLLLLK